MPQLDTCLTAELSKVYSLEVLGEELSVLRAVHPHLLTSLQVNLPLPYSKNELPAELPEHMVVPGIGAAYAGEVRHGMV